MRIADLDTSRGDDCPLGWDKITTPVAACIIQRSNGGCYSTNFSTLNIPYSKVCGMAVGYQKGHPDGFASDFHSTRSINGPYVDGVSITYGILRKHIWTYAIGLTDRHNSPGYNCPCSKTPGPLPPSFVNNNYYCESGTALRAPIVGYFTDNPVWDGEGCSTDNSCCADASLPWFYRQIPMTVNDDIETRICSDESSYSEDVLVKELQLYVQ